jgi:hypothetical protein
MSGKTKILKKSKKPLPAWLRAVILFPDDVEEQVKLIYDYYEDYEDYVRAVKNN